jgi:hypothetical protein
MALFWLPKLEPPSQAPAPWRKVPMIALAVLLSQALLGRRH